MLSSLKHLKVALVSLALWSGAAHAATDSGKTNSSSALPKNYAVEAFKAISQKQASSSNKETSLAQQQQAKAALEKANLLFIENNGQVVDDAGNLRPEILFQANSNGAQVFVTGNSLHYVFRKTNYKKQGVSEATGENLSDFDPTITREPLNTETVRFSVTLEGANENPVLVKTAPETYYENHYLAHCPDGITAKSYKTFTLKNVYPGVDWVIYSHGNGLKYDFVASEAKLINQVRLNVSNASAKITPSGDLMFETQLGKLTENKPVSFQAGKEVVTNFRAIDNNTFGFELKGANANQAITVDPNVFWATYFGGSDAEYARNVALDSDNNAYFTGVTASTNFPAQGGYSNTRTGNSGDWFVIKLAPAGTRVWATYYGGNDYDDAFGVTIDNANNVVVGGRTGSNNFPISVGAFQTSRAGDWEGAIVKFNAAGTRQWATFYGGTSWEVLFGIATSGSDIYVTGHTGSSNLPILNAYQTTIQSSFDAFVAKFSSSGSLLWGTYFGGSEREDGLACATDASGNVYVSGFTESSTNFPLLNAQQSTYGGGRDGFAAKFNTSGSLQWSTFHGGSGRDDAYTCTVDASGNMYIAGVTQSPNMPTQNAAQNTGGGAQDAYLVKYNTSGVRQFSTYCGGGFYDWALALTNDPFGNIYMAGLTASNNFPTLFSIQTHGGSEDFFVVKYRTNGTRVFSTYYGGSGIDAAFGVAIGSDGDLYISGQSSGSFPTTSGAFQTTFSGSYDCAIIKMDTQTCTNPTAPVITAGGPTSICTPGSVTLNGPTLGGGQTYLWSTGETTQNIVVSASGSYTLRAVSGTCTSAVSNAIVVTNNTPTTPTIAATGSTAICGSGNVTIEGPAGFSYIWSNGATTKDITVSAAGSYTLQTITAGCTSAASNAVVVTVNPLPATPTIIANGPTTFCNGSSVFLEGPNGFSYLWSNGATTQSIQVTTGGAYTLQTIASGCTSAVSNTINVNVLACNFTWTGAVNTNWNNPANWSDNAVPMASNVVTIPSGLPRMPVVSGIANASNLTVNGTLSITGTLNVSGNITNNGTISGTGILTMNGTGSQAINGNAITFGNLNIINETGTVTLGTTLNLNTSLNLGSNTTFDLANNTLRLKATPTGTARLSPVGSGATLQNAANFTVEHIFNNAELGSTGGWYFFGAPVAGQTIANLQVMGNNATPNSYIQSNSGGSYFFYDPTFNSMPHLGWVKPTSASTALPIGTGLRTWVIGNAASNNKVFSFKGEPHMSDFVFTQLQKCVSNCPTVANNGYNLISNPHPSTINWDFCSRNQVGGTIYTYRNSLGVYATYNNGVGLLGGRKEIASGQGFIVWATGVAPIVTIPQSAKVGTRVANQRSGATESVDHVLMMRLQASATSYDESAIRLHADATTGFDPEFDAYKFAADRLSLSVYSPVLERAMAIEAQGMVSQGLQRFPLRVSGNGSATAQLSFTGVESFQGKYLYLNHPSFDAPILITEGYSITLTEALASGLEVLVNNSPLSIEKAIETSGFALYPNPATDVLNISNVKAGSEIRILNAQGKLISRQVLSAEGTLSVAALPQGVYFVEVNGSKKSFVKQ